jgi:hypothetical protein
MSDMPLTANTRPLARPLLWLILFVWAAGVYSIARAGGFVQDPAGMPTRIVAAFVGPVAIFAGAYATFPGLRAWVAELDLALVVGLQIWRLVGVVFLVPWMLGLLPAAFALPAALGDIGVSVFAISVTLAVARVAPDWQQGVRWLVILGMTDFAIAFGTAILSGPGRPLHFAGAPLPTMIADLPLVLIPTLGVPLFTILHMIAWLRLKD